MANSKRRCKECGKYELLALCKRHANGWFCSEVCAGVWQINKQRQDREKSYKARTAEKKRQMRDDDRSYWMKKAQSAFNAYIRARDADKPCVSCLRHHQGQYHAGHYRTTAAAPELRFSELNCHKQCAPCNNHKSGNITEYRIELVRRIGQEAVDWLEGPHEPKKYTVDDLKTIEKEYKEKLRTLA